MLLGVLSLKTEHRDAKSELESQGLKSQGEGQRDQIWSSN